MPLTTGWQLLSLSHVIGATGRTRLDVYVRLNTPTNGDVLQASTQVLSVFIDGRPYEPTSKQTRLYDKYRKRLDEAKPGATAPAGGARP